MEFLIADTFTTSLTKLTNEEQRAAKTTAFELQINPAHPSMSFERVTNSKDKNFWSARVSRDIRLIVHKTGASIVLCYVAHHDPAYQWAERRKLEVHPKTGAAQLIEIREIVREVTIPKYVEELQPASPKPPLLANISDDQLLSYGVPREWLSDVRNADEDSIFELTDHLPAEAAEALIDLATGVEPRAPEAVSTEIDPFAHPDAQRRFRVMKNVEELERALDFPWDKWSIFLHPDQRELVQKDYAGPARVSGSAGTGKTIVALHRAVYLARTNADSRILLTTFSDPLANALQSKLLRLISNEPRLADQIEVHSLNAIGRRLYELNLGKAQFASRNLIKQLIEEAAGTVDGHNLSIRFLLAEWEQIVDAWQLETWDDYRDVARLGRKTRLPEKQRALLWSIFEKVRVELKKRNVITEAEMFTRLASHFAENKKAPFDFAVVDEAQDINPSQLRFLAALGGNRPNSLFLAGDLGQRIFQQSFSWKALGVDVRERSNTLRINYRTSHQIRSQSDRLLGPEVSDVDGVSESRSETISIFNGPQPDIRVLANSEEEIEAVAGWLSERKNEGVKPHEIAVFVRSSNELDRARAAVEKSGLNFKVLDEHLETVSGQVSIATMHLAKGLEFRSVVVMACDDDVIPLQERIETITDDADLQEVYDTERHLLYVACTRARDYLLVTSGDRPSEFLDDLTI
ncbi:MAG TPA: UvrD-helicase domain-containing protein [Pyrinomonadaceae bacterium]|nr:UvrD-helicase domain-containing protein [Pyrinomonadaceae bacterium]